jgi:hypothetical protein
MRLWSVAGMAVLAAVPALALGCGGGVEGTGGTGGSGGSPSAGGSGGSAGDGGGGGVPFGECESDADCGGSVCAEITPDGWKTCLSSVPEATMCTPQPNVPDECCTSAECSDGGNCYPSESLPYCGGPAPAQYNQCVADACGDDGECMETTGMPSICAPAGSFGFPARHCLTAFCRTIEDCQAKPGGYCAPVIWSCCGIPLGVACVYPGGCREDQDCASDGSQHCELDDAEGAGVCVDGPALCPA